VTKESSRERKARLLEAAAVRVGLLAVPAHAEAGPTDPLDGLRARIEGRRVSRLQVNA